MEKYLPEEERQIRKLTVYYSGANKPNIPLIRLKGHWLKKAGFSIGDSIEVEISPKFLRIRLQQ